MTLSDTGKEMGTMIALITVTDYSVVVDLQNADGSWTSQPTQTFGTHMATVAYAANTANQLLDAGYDVRTN
jgi:hypothetical protein